MKTVRFEQEAPSAASSSDPAVPLEYFASGETQSRVVSVLVQKSGHVDDDVQISALDALDGRDNRYIKEVLDWYRDAGDVEVSELNELVESMTRLNGLQVKSEKSWKSEEDMHRGENVR